MLSKAWAQQAELDRVHREIREEVDEAVAWAEPEPLSGPIRTSRQRVRYALGRGEIGRGNHLSGSHPAGHLGGDGAGSQRLPHRRGHRRLRRRVQGHGRHAGQVRREPRHRHADRRVRHRRRRHRRIHDGVASGRGDAVRRLHHLRLRPDRQLRRQVPLPLGRGHPDRGAGAIRRRQPRRSVSLPESGGVVRPRAGAQGGGARHRVRRQGPDQVRHPRQRSGGLLRAQGALPPHQGGPAGGRLHRADRQGARLSPEGPDLSIITYGAMVHTATEAADQLPRRASRWRSSTSGRSCRSTKRRSWRA